MTFDQTAQRSVSQHRVLVEVDIGLDNEQWVNNGAGIWTVNPNNSYPWVGPPNQDMVARYALDGDSTDSTGNGNNGTDTAITYEAGKAGQAAVFAGAGSIRTPVIDASGWAGISVSMRLKKADSVNQAMPFEFGAYELNGVYLFCSADGTGFRWIFSEAGLSENEDTGDLTVGEWAHIVMCYDHATAAVRTYLNGVNIIDTVLVNGPIVMPNKVLTLGNYNSANGTVWDWFGSIDEVRIYDRALSAAEVSELFTRDYDAEYFLTGFTAQGFRPIGSVKVDGASLQPGTSILDLTDTPRAWYFDGATLTLYVTMPDFDEPALHTVSIGQVFAFARGAFTPIGGLVPVEGRLVNTPSVSESRDPLFFGRFRYPAISVQLQNGDGEFDLWGRDVDIYGNDARTLIGFENVDYSEYLRIHTGFMQLVNVNEETMNISVSDKRKQLTKPITYATTNTNALTAIEEILAEAYSYTFDSTFYDLDTWNTAKALVANITLNYQEPAAVIDVIEYIAASVFGLFRVDADGLFSFQVIKTDASPVARIPGFDVLNRHSISYDPAEVVSSVRVGYARDWTAAAGEQYTYYTDDTREQTVFNAYKTYEEKTFDTALIDEAAAIAFASLVLDSVDTVRGRETITVPLQYYAVQMGDLVWAEQSRGEQPMLGMQSFEVLGKSWMDGPILQLDIRRIDDTLSAGGLQAYYSFDADSSVDDSGNGNDGTDTDITYEAGLVGRAARFNGTSSGIALPSGAYSVVNGAAPFSVSVRAKLDTLTPIEAVGSVLGFRDGGANALNIRYDSINGDFDAFSHNFSGQISFGAADLLWRHLVVTFDGTILRGYSDGSFIDEDTSVTTTAIVADSVSIGAKGGLISSTNFDGLIDEVRIYNRVLADFEVRELFDNPGLT